MKGGTRRNMIAKPLNRPRPAPANVASTSPNKPRSRPVRLLTTHKATVSELAAMTPSIDRSIEPCRMMNVVPTARMSGMAQRSAIVHRFSIVANPGAARLKPRHRKTSLAQAKELIAAAAALRLPVLTQQDLDGRRASCVKLLG